MCILHITSHKETTVKKLILTLLAAVTVSAQAGEAKPYYQIANSWQENRVTGANSIAPEFVLGAKDGPWQYSAKLAFSQAEWGNGSITNTVEGRLRYNFNSVTGMKLKPWAQLRLGEQIKSNTDFAYYALDLGLTTPITNTFDLDFTYRYRNAFDESNNFETDRYGVEGKLKLTAKDSIGIRYTQSYGDSQTDAWRLQYTRAF